MSDHFRPIDAEALAAWVFDELRRAGSVFGVPREAFFTPRAADRFTQTLYGQRLETPFGVAAGPHSQLAQNIVVAWLCGARFIELKTVQVLDELDVPKPCIDMQDEGYNVEWSQELRIGQSLEEYLRAWVLIHALHRQLGFPGEPGVIFNMSVGYDLAGVRSPKVDGFLDAMADGGERLAELVEIVARHAPDIRQITVPRRISDNVTLSTMHGCPPDEVGRISEHLLRERGLHTTVKLNPTLLGPDGVRGLLAGLGYRDVHVPDSAFGHDLRYADALSLLRGLGATAAERALTLGVKLTNTLEVENRRDRFDRSQQTMYLSGRPLHAIGVNVARRLRGDLGPDLLMSFAGGADAFNAADLLRCGFRTVTTCSDLLRYGGYLRLRQYLDKTAEVLEDLGVHGIDELAADAPAHLAAYAERVAHAPELHKHTFDRERTKTSRALGAFDCVVAPCADECPVHQQVPRYMALVREGRWAEAAVVARVDNPMTAVLGRACDHKCQQTCVRTHLDEPLAIREIKRAIASRERTLAYRSPERSRPKVAVVGAGPLGLGVARFLGEAGYPVTVYEARDRVGGMVAGSIPAYRSPQDVVAQDVDRVRALGVQLETGVRVGRELPVAALRARGFRYVVVGAGAQLGLPLGIPGESSAGVIDGLDLLRRVREGRFVDLGERVGVVGGGDVAMDCARTAARLTGRPATVIYRRTRHEMPAQREEVADLLAEGNTLVELAAPLEVVAEDGRVAALRCQRMALGPADASGRRRPVPVAGETFDLPLDALIVAIGQRPDLGALAGEGVALAPSGYVAVDAQTGETSVPGLFAGGDVAGSGPATIVAALGDAKRIAAEIRRREEGLDPRAVTWPAPRPAPVPRGPERAALLLKRATRRWRQAVPHRDASDRRGFEEVIQTMTPEQAAAEASRCVSCERLCSTCVGVCPNLAFLTWDTEAVDLSLAAWRRLAGAVERRPDVRFRVSQPHQVAVFNPFCNACGNCATFCPTAGQPYRDKPRLFLHEDELAAESDNAFQLRDEAGRPSIRGRFRGEDHALTLDDGAVAYRSPAVRATLDPRDLSVRDVVLDGLAEGAEVDLRPAATLWTLLVGLRASAPWLPVAS